MTEADSNEINNSQYNLKLKNNSYPTFLDSLIIRDANKQEKEEL